MKTITITIKREFGTRPYLEVMGELASKMLNCPVEAVLKKENKDK